MLDLTPFGFTPTESHAYTALLGLGPSSGYAVAKALSIARANAYQALDGLVTKGAATLVGDGSPRRYRAVQPRSLLALLVETETRKLDVLEQQLLEQPQTGSEAVTRLSGERAINDVAVRLLLRSEGELHCLGPGTQLSAWAPVLRARAAAGKALAVWISDSHPVELPVPAQLANAERTREALGPNALLLVGDGALVATVGQDPEGIWSEAGMVRGLVRAAIAYLGSE